MTFLGRSLFSIFSVVILLVTLDVQAVDDEYMHQLEEEVANVHLDKSGQKRNSGAHNIADDEKEKVWVGECDYIGGVVSENLVRAEFSSHIEQCSLATFVYYHRLNHDEQHAVFETYLKTSPIKFSELQKNILTYF